MRAFFAGRGQVTCALEKWDDKGVGAKSPSFGAATFSPQAFERLQFNLDQQSAKEEEIDSADAEGQDGDPPIKGGARINQRAVILE